MMDQPDMSSCGMQSGNYDNQAIEHPAQNGVSFMLQ